MRRRFEYAISQFYDRLHDFDRGQKTNGVLMLTTEVSFGKKEEKMKHIVEFRFKKNKCSETAETLCIKCNISELMH